MATEFSSNVSIAGLVLEVNPETFVKGRKVFGSNSRTTAANLVLQETAKKYLFTISGITQSQFEEIQKRAALDMNIELIDFIPISERIEITRTVHELLSTETISGETIYRYVPSYQVAVIDYEEEWRSNTMTYKIILEEM